MVYSRAPIGLFTSWLPTGSVLGVCYICMTVKKDTNPKPVVYCDTCEAYMCQECWGRWPLRITAAATKVARLIFQGGQ